MVHETQESAKSSTDSEEITYPKTKAEIFSRVWEHFVVNRSPLSFDRLRNGDVLGGYRTDAGKCAVGLFMSDECYQALQHVMRVENRTVAEMAGDTAAVRSLLQGESRRFLDFVDENLELLIDLQNAHDDACVAEVNRKVRRPYRTHAYISSKLNGVAEKHGITNYEV